MTTTHEALTKEELHLHAGIGDDDKALIENLRHYRDVSQGEALRRTLTRAAGRIERLTATIGAAKAQMSDLADRLVRHAIGEANELEDDLLLAANRIRELEHFDVVNQTHLAGAAVRLRELEAALAHADEVSATFEKAAWDQMGRIRELEAALDASEKRFEALKSAYDKERKRTVEIYGSTGRVDPA
jgi:chromosome segregation ATPase